MMKVRGLPREGLVLGTVVQVGGGFFQTHLFPLNIPLPCPTLSPFSYPLWQTSSTCDLTSLSFLHSQVPVLSLSLKEDLLFGFLMISRAGQCQWLGRMSVSPVQIYILMRGDGLITLRNALKGKASCFSSILGWGLGRGRW